LNISLQGVITGFTVTAVNADERVALWEISQGIQGLLIGDKGYLSADLKRDLAAQNLQLETPCRRNMKYSLLRPLASHQSGQPQNPGSYPLLLAQ
jgi:hypothetical protein